MDAENTIRRYLDAQGLVTRAELDPKPLEE
jgi:hypothetical protein